MRTSCPVQYRPLEVKEDPEPSRRDTHTGGTPPNQVEVRKEEKVNCSTIQAFHDTGLMYYDDKIQTFGVCLRLRASLPCSRSACRFR